MNNIKLFVFDLAGTTVKDNNTVGGCLQKALKSAGLEASVTEVNTVMGYPKPTAITILLNRHGVEGDVSAIFEEFRGLMTATYRDSSEVLEIDGAREVFLSLKDRGMRIAVDTGFDRGITDILLDRMPWEGLIDDSITSDEVENGRPHPDMILELCRRAGVEPVQTVKVGDTPSDIQEGKAAGAGLTVGTLFGTHTREELLAHQPDLLISDLRDLLSLSL
jgi:phosphonatase-like hydrolase